MLDADMRLLFQIVEAYGIKSKQATQRDSGRSGRARKSRKVIEAVSERTVIVYTKMALYLKRSWAFAWKIAWGRI
jgi:hypothetical protein